MARKILLADDSVTAQNMGRKILIDAGYDVITVNNGSAALKKISEQKPDLIVLDVYMPGYSGLEVCQRVKEDEETARIPVLLTVGKLEPFKPEEARKAKADAYIVKPFEASELLVAVTKLEDKVVPPPGPGKAGRPAKAGPEQSFGDTESGWKKRLRFPTPASKAAVQPPAQAADKPASEELPKDITPEEIAAIAAAAAQVGGAPHETAAPAQSSSPDSAAPDFTADRAWPKPESAAISELPATEASSSSAEMPPATFASAMDAQAESSPAPVTEVSQANVVAEVMASEPSSVGSAAQEGKAEEGKQPAPVVEPAVVVPVASESGTSNVTEVVSAPADADVIAALQSLSPTNGDGGAKLDTTAQSAEPKLEDNPMAAVLAAVASAEMAAVPSGPRWVAESVAVDPEEGTLILEREMEKAYAAFAAADGARASFAGPSTETSAMTSAEASVVGMAATESVRDASLNAVVAPSIPEPESVAGASLAESRSEEPAAQAEAATAAATIAQDTPVQDQAQIASPPPTLHEEKPAAPPVREAPADAVASEVVPAATDVAESHARPESVAETESIAQPEAAASAAAGAPGGGEWHSVAAAASMPYPAQELPGQRDVGASDGGDRSEDADLNAANAAAWANWRQIRETVVAASSQVADAAAASFKEIRHEAPAKPQPEGASTSESSSSSSASEATAIASIVESVLSELKPKLVEEIARKMASDKKKE